MIKVGNSELMNMQKCRNALLKQLDKGKREQKKIDKICSGLWELMKNESNSVICF